METAVWTFPQRLRLFPGFSRRARSATNWRTQANLMVAQWIWAIRSGASFKGFSSKTNEPSQATEKRKGCLSESDETETRTRMLFSGLCWYWISMYCKSSIGLPFFHLYWRLIGKCASARLIEVILNSGAIAYILYFTGKGPWRQSTGAFVSCIFDVNNLGWTLNRTFFLLNNLQFEKCIHFQTHSLVLPMGHEGCIL